MNMPRMRKSRDGWTRVSDPRMKWHGDIDDKKKIIRVNKSPKKNKKRGEMINTLAHEELHRTNSKLTEREVAKEVKKRLSSMSKKSKNKLYSKYK